jgi:hypothetical protein
VKFRMLAVALLAFLAGAFALVISPAQATPTNVDNPCGVTGWYVNPDETDNAPARTADGFLFEGKDLIHHEVDTLLDFPDIKATTLSFEATVAGKVVGKMETMNPYSTIVQNADGKFWSTAMTYAQEGGQGHPVENVSDLLGKDVKPGKVKFGETSKVTTFGVGYWDTPGSTVVTSITFHGKKYDFTCEKTRPTTPPATVEPTTPVVTPPAENGGDGGGSTQTPDPATLPVTGDKGNTGVMIAVVGGSMLLGGVLIFAGNGLYRRYRKPRFTA